MPRKRTSGLPKRPTAVRKAPGVTQEPSTDGQAPPVSPETFNGQPVNETPSREYLAAVDFEQMWNALTPREKDKARAGAERHGLTLRNLLRLRPEYRHQEG
jgi:hypothetical protein